MLGPDYFFGDPIQNHDNEEGFDRGTWMAKTKKGADECVPRWFAAVKEKYGLAYFLVSLSFAEDHLPRRCGC